MHSTAITFLTLFLLPISALQVPSIFASFYEPHVDDSLLRNESSIATEHDLLKRDGNCPVNFNACLQDGYGGACCTVGAVCTTDGARNVACCPIGATCTGTITAGAAATTTGGGGVFGSATTTTTNTATIAPTTAGPVSVITNAFFPFPIIATSYPNSAACNSAYLACQTNYAACTANLQGGGFGVTVVAPQGGVTVAPTAQNLGASSATSICSSLSQQACYGIVSENCAQFGQGTGGSFVVSQTGNFAARPTVGCFAAAGIMAGVGLGIAGQIV
jgi:hypothetical protein